MGLFLVEATFKNTVETTEEFKQKVEKLTEAAKKDQVDLIEVQVAKDFSRFFFIFEGEDETQITTILTAQNIAVQLVKAVRIVGKELDEVKKESDHVNYLVEWNLPEDLTMDQYLDRKKTNSVHYSEVPEVAFARTYVCEDMSKCLCFYDAPDEDSVKRARAAVKTPIDSITEISSDN